MPPRNKIQLAALPVEVLVCLALTPLAWVVYLASQIVADGTISILQLGMAGLCSLVLFSLRGWGRWLCVVYDGLLVAALVYQGDHGQVSALVIAQGATFAVAAVALFWPATSRAFRQAATQAEAGVVSQ